MAKITRREFLQQTLATGLWTFGLGSLSLIKAEKKSLYPSPSVSNKQLKNRLVVTEGDNPKRMALAAVAALGGMERFVSTGQTVVVKPNIGWDRRPEQAANTNPQVVASVVEMCLAAGAKKVKVFDRTCNEKHLCYKNSGIAQAAKEAGAEVKFVENNDFIQVEVPKGKALKKCLVHKDILTADVIINLPIAKHHSSTMLSLGMKNLMGLVGGNRGFWHLNLDRYIADFNTFVPIDLTIMDAYRILIDHGPSGGRLEDVKLTKQIIAGIDRVAVDAYSSTLFNLRPEEIDYIRYGYELGLGEIDLKRIKIERIRT